jgi:hypothetical protein
VSADESRNEKALVLLEHNEALIELATLKERAKRIGKDIQQFGIWLADDPARKIYVHGQDQHGLPTDLLDDRYSVSVNFQEAIGLADEIRASVDKVKSIDLRKRNLGLA